MNVLCKFRGMLVIAEATKGGEHSRCPECGSKTLWEGPHGWLECEGECGFAVLKEHWDKVIAEGG